MSNRLLLLILFTCSTIWAGVVRLNVVERRLRELPGKALRRGVQVGAESDQQDRRILVAHTAKGMEFIWTATTEQILAKVARGCVLMAQVNQI